MSWAVVDVDSGTDRVDTSTTDPSFAGGAVTGSDLGCTEAAGGAVTGSDLGCTEAVVFVPGASAVTSLLDGALSAVRIFGFFGVDAAADVSEPDFLSVIVAAADFLPVPLPPLPFATPSSAVLSLTSVVDSAASSPDGPDDWEDPAVLDDGDEESDESADELDEPGSVGSAHATPGVVATATPTPKATAKPPTRPTYLA